MTRVNLVPPGELHDQHLFAEFRELKMVPKSLARSLRAASRRGAHDCVAHVLSRIPQQYVLGTGHVSFFYDKGLYLHRRYSALRTELRRRQYNFDRESRLDPDHVFDQDLRLLRDYKPTPEALALVRSRILEKVQQKPFWYRKTLT